jgi:putative peptide zinc metalloprotease protein
VRTSLFSSSWYRVADLKPRLRCHAQMHRQRFRGQTWYVLQDHQTGRFHRLSPAAHAMTCLMNGRRTMNEIWDLVGRRLGNDQPTQDETIQLLAQLHRFDLLLGETPPDMAELARRSRKQRVRTLVQRIRNPLALRFPLLDPDRFLDATLPLVRPLFSVVGLVAWLLLVGIGGVLAALHWPELTANVSDRVLATENILILLLVYPLVKAIHELGHGYATKVWGGEVHEIGVMLLVLMPIPYVDASASSAFREKWRRAVVGGAGIMVELALAAAAMLVWVNAEAGVVRAVAFNVMLIGGVSTLLFNGNPLLRFDGYYVLCDVVEIPSLGTRANRYVLYLVQRYLLGVDNLVSPVTARGERSWFVAYALASFVYRVFIVLTIALFIASQLFVVGVLLALSAVAGLVVWPVVKGLVYVATNPRLHRKRRRAVAVVGTAVAVTAAALLWVRVPYATVAEGVVWTHRDASVRARADGFVETLMARPNDRVEAGQALLVLDDPMLAPEIDALGLHVQELRLRLDSIRMIDLVQAEMLREQIRHAEADLAEKRQRQRDLTVRSSVGGVFVVAKADDLPGRFVRRGDRLGYVLDDDAPLVRIIVPQADVDLVRSRTRRVDVRFAERPDRVFPAVIGRESPAAVDEVPSLALSTQGGGAVALDPRGADRGLSLESLFLFDIEVEDLPPMHSLGGRAYVRFDHGDEPLAFRLARSVRQVFLSRFDV